MTLERNRIIEGDNVEILRGFPNDCIDLTVTSPPYDNLRDYKGYNFRFEPLALELFRITKRGGYVVWIVGDETKNQSESLTSFKQAIFFREIAGFNLLDTMIYEKAGITYPDIDKYYQSFEYMLVLTKGKPKTFNPLRDRKNISAGTKIHGKERQRDGSLTVCSGAKKGRIKTDYGMRFNVWKTAPSSTETKNGRTHMKHPATMPEKLAEGHIYSWSNPGDLILDPMCGSGTTCAMAVKLRRDYIGIDVAPEYCEIARARIAPFEKQGSIF